MLLAEREAQLGLSGMREYFRSCGYILTSDMRKRITQAAKPAGICSDYAGGRGIYRTRKLQKWGFLVFPLLAPFAHSPFPKGVPARGRDFGNPPARETSPPPLGKEE